MEKFTKKLSAGKCRIGVLICSLLLVIAATGTLVAGQYAATINHQLGISTSEVVGGKGQVYYPTAYDSLEEMYTAKAELMREVAQEGTVLLKNENGALPMSSGSITLYGADQFKCYTNTGGGSTAEENKAVTSDLVEALTNSGFSVYTEGETGSDMALVVLGRNGAEGSDVEVGSMALTQEELGWIAAAKASGARRVVVLSSGDFMVEMRDLEADPEIDAILHLGNAGLRGAYGLADVISGAANPSGKLVETAAANSLSSPAMENFGNFSYTNGSAVMASQAKVYVVYEEGIYVDYKYYETRYEDTVLGQDNAASAAGATAGNAWNYREEVVYPYGYGLSYTNFTQELVGEPVFDEENHTATVEVKVTNTGNAAGKEVVQLYAQSPYTDYDKKNLVEKSAVQLMGFGKTKTLEPGESETVTITANMQWLASYDYMKAKGYIMDAGTYYFAVGNGAHDALNNILAAKGKTTADGMDANGNAALTYSWVQKEFDDKTYAESVYTGEKVTNSFEDADINYWLDEKDQITYLSRNDWAGTYPTTAKITATEDMLAFLNDTKRYENGKWNDTAERAEKSEVTYGADNSMTAASMIGLDYDDPAWEKLLDQMTIEEISNMVANGNGQAQACTSINFPAAPGADSPIGLAKPYIYVKMDNQTGEMTDIGSSYLVTDPFSGKDVDLAKMQGTMYSSEPVLAATYNTELAERVGVMYGEDGVYTGSAFIWGIGADMHRTPYGGRASEYYSADSVHTSLMGAAVTGGCNSMGLVSVAKHFVINEQETNRIGVATYTNEQALRENNLRCFEGIMTYGEAPGIMASYNRIGMMGTGAEYDLMTGVLRKEWGSDAYVITDLNGPTSGLYDGNAIIAAGTSTMLNNGPYDSASGAYVNCTLNEENIESDAALLYASREACHRIIHAFVNSNVMNGMSADAVIKTITPAWQIALWVVDAILAVLTLIFGAGYLLAVNRESEKKKANPVVLAGLTASMVLSVISFVMLHQASYEASENTALVIILAVITLILGIVGQIFDVKKIVSLAAYVMSVVTLCSLVAGRVSYLGFYLAGDVMNTGLSVFFVTTVIFMILGIVFAAMGTKPQKEQNAKNKVKVVVVLVIAVVMAAGLLVQGAANGVIGSGSFGKTEDAGLAKLEAPSKDAAYWQAYTVEQSASEDVSDKTIQYQFYAEKICEPAYGMGVVSIINLYSDGYCRMTQYSTRGGTIFYYNGYWTLMDEETLYFGFSNYAMKADESIKDAAAENNYTIGEDVCTVDYSYNVMPSGGQADFTINVCLGFANGGQFVRSVDVKSDGMVVYETEEEFVKFAEERAKVLVEEAAEQTETETEE